MSQLLKHQHASMQRTVFGDVVAYSLNISHHNLHHQPLPHSAYIYSSITSFIFKDLEVTSPPTLLLPFLSDSAIQNFSLHTYKEGRHNSSSGFNPCFFLLKYSLWFFLHSNLIILGLFLMCSQRYVRMKPDENKLQLHVQAVTRKLQQIC